MEKADKPAFLECDYIDIKTEEWLHRVVAPIPDGTQACHMVFHAKGRGVWIDVAECSPGSTPPPPPFLGEEVTDATDFDGLRLHETRDALKAETARRGGIWTDGGPGRDDDVVFTAPPAHYRVSFSEQTGLSRQIALIGPLPPILPFAFAYEAVKRFGAPYQPIYWLGRDKAWIELCEGSWRDPVTPYELRLRDHKSPYVHHACSE